MHFCNKRGLHPDPELKLYNSPIKIVSETKCLGLLFDSKLTFLPHIKMLKNKSLKAFNILKFVSSTDWGADGTVLLNLYRSLIRSKLDYGYIVYGSARPSYIKLLDTVHHQGLRLSLGAFRTSPVESLYVEANKPSLENRRLSDLVCSMQPNCRLILQILHMTVFLILYMKMFTINNPIQFNLL
jgi:hypothetical protein